MLRITRFLLATTMFAGVASAGHAQTVLYQENFDTGCVAGLPARPVPAPLITHNVDGRTPNATVAYVNNAWVVREDLGGNVANCVAFSTSYYSPVGSADDWLVLPPIAASADTRLSWKAKAYDPAFPDGYEVRISTGSSAPADFTVVAQTIAAAPSAWTSYQLSLSAFAGQTVRIAFRNNSNDKFLLVLDDLLIANPTSGAGTVASIPTLSEWALIGMSSLLAMLGISRMRRRQR